MLNNCPTCGKALQKGLSSKAVGLSFVSPQKFKHFAFVGEDLNRRSVLRKIFPSAARFCPSYVCRACSLYLVDYGTVLSRHEADELAASL